MALAPLQVPIDRPLPGRPGAAPDASREELARSAQEFEAMVLAELLGPMFSALDTQSLGGGGFGEQMIRPMLVREYANAIASRGGIGVADAVLAQLLATQAGVGDVEPR
jgi:Rod binding domain-containing protein